MYAYNEFTLLSNPSVRQVQNHFRQVVKMCDERCRRNGQMQHSKVSKGSVDLSKVPSLEKVKHFLALFLIGGTKPADCYPYHSSGTRM